MLRIYLLCGFCLLLKALMVEAAVEACKTQAANDIVRLTNKGELNFLNSSSSSNYTRCITWILTVPEGSLVKLIIIVFDYLDGSCNNSTFQIRDGRSSSGDAFKSLCELRKRDQVTLFSSGRHLWIQLQSSSDNKAEIFAVFDAVNQTSVGLCRGPQDKVITLTNKRGSFFSPLFPSDFPAGIRCTWVITAPEGHFVKLSIKSFLLDNSCSYSFLYIQDGRNSTSNLLHTFCGDDFQRSVFSSGRHLRVQLNSTTAYYPPASFIDYHAPGFLAVYEAVKQLPAPFACTAASHSITLKSQSGTLASYNYPLPYDDAIECTWRFDVDSDYKIELLFDVFNLSLSPKCSVDYVEFEDARYCGSWSNVPKRITLESSDMRIKFKSSGKAKYPGFKASYETKRTTTAILKVVGICVGATLIALCVVSKVCYRCCKSGNQTELVYGQTITMDTETEEIHSQEQSTTV